jgi:hypothetical protein
MGPQLPNLVLTLITLQEGGDLEQRHIVDIGLLLTAKKDSTRDLLTIFSDIVSIRLKSTKESLRGRWCMSCK